MKVRHQARLLAVQFLFQRDFNKGPLDDALGDFWSTRQTGRQVSAFAEALIRGVEQHRSELDERMGQYAEHWDVKRMGAVDRNIMRVALFEMLHRPDVPPVVSVNEAVDLAKEFNGIESARFINGILDRAVRAVKRPARCAIPDPRFGYVEGEK